MEEKDKLMTICVYCSEKQASILFRPCGHIVACKDCRQDIKYGKFKQCITYRLNIKTEQEIYYGK